MYNTFLWPACLPASHNSAVDFLIAEFTQTDVSSRLIVVGSIGVDDHNGLIVTYVKTDFVEYFFFGREKALFLFLHKRIAEP